MGDQATRKIEDYYPEKLIGYYGLSNTATLCFFEPKPEDDCDLLVALSIVDSGFKEMEEANIEYEYSEEDQEELPSYVMWGDMKVYLNDVMCAA